jgi:hypothetical protein
MSDEVLELELELELELDDDDECEDEWVDDDHDQERCEPLLPTSDRARTSIWVSPCEVGTTAS